MHHDGQKDIHPVQPHRRALWRPAIGAPRPWSSEPPAGSDEARSGSRPSRLLVSAAPPTRRRRPSKWPPRWWPRWCGRAVRAGY